MLWKKSLTFRLVISFWLMVILPLIAIASLAYYSGKQNIISDLENHLQSVAVLKEQEIKKWVHHLEDIITLLASSPHMIKETATLTKFSADDPEYLVAHDSMVAEFNRIVRLQHISMLFFLNSASGQIIVSSDPGREGQFRMAESWFFRGKTSVHVSDIFYCLSLERPTMVIATPVTDSRDQLVGVIAGHVNLEALSEVMVERIGLGETGETYLVNQSNLLLSKSRSMPEAVFKKWIFTKGVSRALEGESGVGLYTGYREEPVIGAYCWIEDRKMALLAEIDQAEAFTPIVALRNTVLLVGVSTLLLVGLLALLVARTITKPVRRLVVAANEIGQGNLDYRIEVASRDELGQLATTFNHMASKRKQAESALRESENRFRDISHSMADWIWEVDKNGRYTFASDTVKNVLGYSSDELIGKNPFELMPAKEGDRVKEIFLEIVSRSGPINDLEHWSLAKDGAEVCLLTNGVQFFNEDQELQGYRGVDKDITHQKKIEAEKASIEEQFRQAQKMESVGRLAGGVAHDYNNALTVITGFTELAMSTMDSNEPIYGDLNEVLKAARQAADITRQLLAFARKQTIAPEVIDLNENVKTVLKMLQRLIGEDISLVWLPGADLWSVKIDPSQIDQIMANLCVNARDAISGIGKITIETGTVVLDTAYCADHYGFIPGEFVMLSVSDNGCGIDSEILNNIFEPFFTTKPAEKGTGLGLATVYGIVKQNNGFINVYSEPGEGTTIRIYLPRHEGDAVAIQRESADEIPSGHGETILIVEDELVILKVTKKILNGLGYNVLTASTPEEAMDVVEKLPEDIHLLLTDVIMPGMNGRELSGRLQSICPDLKCVFMSGYTANAIAHHGVLDKGLFFIQKPFSKSNLAKIVRKALDAKPVDTGAQSS